MKALGRLRAADVAALRGVVFDLDGTLLTDGKLTSEAVEALWQLWRGGLRLIGCTGRSAQWGAVLQRVLPLQACLVENGAIAFVAGEHGIVLRDAAGADRSRRETLLRDIAERLSKQFEDLHYTDDNDGRISDITFDIGEHYKVSDERVAAICAFAHRLGAHTFTSSIHLHITLEGDDKASGTVRLLGSLFDDDPTAALHRYAFIGDSGNDAACFNAFALTFGVANVARYIPQLSRPPRFLCGQAQGAGFAEMAARVLALRGSP